MGEEKKKLVLDEKDLMKAAQNMRPQRYVPPPRPVGEQLPHYEFKNQRPLMSYFPWKTLFVFLYLTVSAFFYYKYDEKSALNITYKSLEYVLTSGVLKAPLNKNPGIKKKLEWLQSEVKLKQKSRAGATAIAGANAAPAAESQAAAPAALSVGNKFFYRYRVQDDEKAIYSKDTVIEWELMSRQDRKLKWEGSEGSSVNTENPFLPPLAFNGSSIFPSEQNTIEGDPSEIFPLTEGKVVTYQVTPLIAGHDKPYEYTCTVGGPGTVPTPIGILKTVAVICVSNEAKPRTAQFSFSPRMNHWVKQHTDLYVGGKHYTVQAELTGFESGASTARTPASN